MHDWSAYNIFVLVLAILPSFSTILALSVPPSSTTTRAVANTDAVMSSRRAWFQRMAFATMTITTAPTSAQAADCFQDCLSNCRLIAPKDPLYCQQNCREYCDQPDRTGKSCVLCRCVNVLFASPTYPPHTPGSVSYFSFVATLSRRFVGLHFRVLGRSGHSWRNLWTGHRCQG